MSEKSSFWKLFLGSGSVTVFNTLRAFVVNKLLAVFLPPSAFACVGQFMNLMTIGQATSSLSMQNGWVSLSAQNRNNVERLLGVWHGGFRLTVLASVFTCVVAVIFCFVAPLQVILPNVPERLAQAAILFALPGIVATNIVTICASVMNGLGRYRRWAAINIGSALWQMLWVAFFLYTERLSVLSIIATQSIFAAFFALQMASRAGFSFDAIRKTALDIRGPWASFAMMGIVPMILSPIVLSLVRSFIGSDLGWDAAGIWQGLWKISDFFASILSAVLGVILLPRISSQLSKSNFARIFNPILLRMAGISLVMVAFIYLARNWVVPLFLSKAYLGACDYMHFQLLGDFFRSVGWCFGFVLIARQETKSFLAIEIVSQAVFAIASIVGIRLFEFQGPMMAYAFENLLTMVALWLVVRKLKWNIR